MTRLDELQSAYAVQQSLLVTWLSGIPASAWDRRSRLAGWSVRELGFHATDMTSVVVRALATGPVTDAPLSIAGYTSAWLAAGAQIAARDRESAAGLDPAAVLVNAAAARADLLGVLASVAGDPVVPGRRGPLRLSDLMTTRVNELVVHSLDLAASLPDLEPLTIDRQALGISCRMLTGILAERVPGRTVEVRVPPYAAIQCVEGPRHTRGTPANVVETDPVPWVELATGRMAWADAVSAGLVRASGERADLSPYLPVLS
ncbi:MAG TPA: sterol carrier family protein [Mycobacteriales bacterium]|nr:sterol carrier family protein [Mycobacteriales bacterium]